MYPATLLKALITYSSLNLEAPKEQKPYMQIRMPRLLPFIFESLLFLVALAKTLGTLLKSEWAPWSAGFRGNAFG